MNLEKQIEITALTEKNRQLFGLSPHVEYRAEQNQIMFYNTLFDSALPLALKPDGSAEIFAEELRKGVDNIEAFLTAYFPANSEDIYKILVHKKIIE